VRAASNAVTDVRCHERPKIVQRWTRAICGAAAWLEAVGLAHGDIHPSNLLLDHDDRILLADFECVGALGDDKTTSTYPYPRLLGQDAGDACGELAVLGAETEQFAIASIVYYILYGHQVYGNVWFRAPT
jgi:serine/threonine protein kinase